MNRLIFEVPFLICDGTDEFYETMPLNEEVKGEKKSQIPTVSIFSQCFANWKQISLRLLSNDSLSLV
jgi:hypothetical protein